MAYRETDWLETWRELVDLRKERRGGGLPSLAEPVRAEEYEVRTRKKNQDRDDPLLGMILADVRPAETVLDVGAGTGRWAVPLARAAAAVTAVDPSRAMLDILGRNARAGGVEGRITVIQSTWEEAEVGPHDVVACAHAVYMSPDLKAFVLKMEAIARRRCYLAMRILTPDGVMADLARAIHGRRHDSPDFVIGYNALHSMGIYGNVLVEQARHQWRDRDLDSAFSRAKRHLLVEGSTCHDALIRRTLEQRLMRRDGAYAWPDGMQSALVWWDVRR